MVIIDDNSIIRQVMTSSIDSKELAKDVVTTVALLKKHKVICPSVPCPVMLAMHCFDESDV